MRTTSKYSESIFTLAATGSFCPLSTFILLDPLFLFLWWQSDKEIKYPYYNLISNTFNRLYSFFLARFFVRRVAGALNWCGSHFKGKHHLSLLFAGRKHTETLVFFLLPHFCSFHCTSCLLIAHVNRQWPSKHEQDNQRTLVRHN